MLKRIALMTTVLMLVTACQPEHNIPPRMDSSRITLDKTQGPKPTAPPQSPKEPAKAVSLLSGTATGEIEVAGEKKKIEVTPTEKSISTCEIVKETHPATSKSYVKFGFGLGLVHLLVVQLNDENLAPQIEPYLAEIQDPTYSSGKSPLKISVASDKSLLSASSLAGTEVHTLNCGLEISGQEISNRIAEIASGGEQFVDLPEKGAKVALKCDGTGKVKALDLIGYCKITTHQVTSP